MAHELLDGLSPVDVERVLNLGARMTLQEGSLLFRMGDPAESLFFIDRGRVRLTLPILISDKEHEIFIEERRSGHAVGWSSLVSPYCYILTAHAMEEVELVALLRKDLCAFCEAVPQVGQKLALNLASALANRLQVVQTMWVREMQHLIELKSGQVAGSTIVKSYS